ncbi:hypothetical protein D9M71_804700 [compost metagenome]
MPLYMADRYRLRLSKLDRRVYEAWNHQNPVSDWERWRNQSNTYAMGWGNHCVGEVDLGRCGARVCRR